LAKPTRTENVTDRLRADILAGLFPPGERLVELHLTEKYDVGRAAIRSAFLELGKEGLVTRETNRGATVRKLSLDEAIEINEARASLEGLLARHAAVRATQAERVTLDSLAVSMRKSVATSDPVGYSKLDRDLHAEIRNASRHAVAQQLVATLSNQSAHHPLRIAMMPGRPSQSLPEHVAIVEAIVAGNETAAEAAMHRHIASVIDALRKARGVS